MIKGSKHTPEAIERMRSWQIGRKTGPPSAETRAKIALAQTGKRHSDETKKKISGAGNGQWRGGRLVTEKGYVRIHVGRDHPMATSRGYVLEHRLVMSTAIGRTLLPGEVVHHIDGDRQNNLLDNLMLFASHSEHMAYERPTVKESN